MTVQYPELIDLGDDEYFVEGAYMFKGEMPHEEVSKVIIKRKIKKVDKDSLAKKLKESYGVNRVNFITIEK
jgi:hypothetical protein